MEKIESLTRTTLKKRGWTEKLIKLFFPIPSETKENPMYKSAAPMQLYHLSKVIEIENTKEFKNALVSTNKFKESSKKAIETKINKLNDYLKNLKIDVPVFERKDLLKKSIDHFNDRNDIERASRNSDSAFLNRITVNFIRHILTNYEDELEEIFGKVGVNKAYLEVKKKVYDAISVKYPYLKPECDEQYERTLSRHKLYEDIK